MAAEIIVHRCRCEKFVACAGDLWHLCRVCGGIDPESFDRLETRGILKPYPVPMTAADPARSPAARSGDDVLPKMAETLKKIADVFNSPPPTS